jgi:hypothetical protein
MSITRLTLIALLVAKTASAQTGYPSVRQGFWFGGGLGAGAGTLACGICEGGGGQGAAGYLRAGFTRNPRMLLGAELGAWQKNGEGGLRRILALTAGMWWYPKPTGGQFFRVSAGLSQWRSSLEQEAVKSRAIALVVGAGYDVRVGPKLSIVPFLNLLGSSNGSLWLEEWDEGSYARRRLPSSAHTLLLQAGVGLTRH